MLLYFLWHFFVIPTLNVLWVLSVDDKDDLDLSLWCVLDVGEGLQSCDNIGLCEGIGLGKGLGMMTRFVVEKLTLVFGGEDR